MPCPATILYGPAHVQIYNDAYIAIAKDRHPTLLGRPVAEGWPDVYETVIAPLLARTGAGQAVRQHDFSVALMGSGGGTERRIFDTNWSPIRDETGKIVGALQTLTEVTDIHRAQAALHASEARLAAAFESVPAGIAVLDLEGRVVLANSEYRRFLPSGVMPSRDPERGWRWRAWDGQGRLIEPENYPGARALRGESVVPGLDMLYTNDEGRESWTRVATVPIRDAGGRVVGQSSVISDIDVVKRNADVLRESEERQAFLLKLSDALRPTGDPVAIQETAARVLGEYLGTDRAYFVAIDNARQMATVEREYRLGDTPSLIGEHPFAAYGATLERLRVGTPVVIDDIETDPKVHAADLPTYQALGLRAFLDVPLVKDGELVCAMCVVSARPRRWTGGAIRVVEEVAERTWSAVERARAEKALRESEARFQQFAKASAAALWIRDAATLDMEYASPAIQPIYGVPSKLLYGDLKHWAALIVPDDRDTALTHLERARAGDAVTHEFRILRPSDGAFRWVRNTDFPLFDEHGRVQRIGGIAEDVTEAKQAVAHQNVLLHELQHRVRNIMTMIRSVANQTGDTAADVEDYRDMLQGRLQALSRVQVLLTASANAGVDLATLIHTEIDAQAAHEGQFTLNGPDLVLSPKAAEVLSLAIHELATNALKYGAFSHAAGRLAVSWSVIYPAEEPWLRLDWIETGASAPLGQSRREGFGTSLVQRRIPYELRGHGSLTIEPDGARCRMEFPLRRRDSILETDTATLSTTIAGGALDMTGEMDLNGCKVLVIEDDYFIALDTERALRRAGGHVLGPVGHEDQALTLLARERPSCAVVDLNLGSGIEFRLSEALQDANVPFVFLTGYDDEKIPARFDGIERLRKPADFRQIVRAAARLCAV